MKSRRAPETLEDARESIQNAIETDGQFSHNICGCVLRMVAEKFGKEESNKLVDEFALTEIYGIHKQP